MKSSVKPIPTIHWQEASPGAGPSAAGEGGPELVTHSARWLSERDAPPPAQIRVVDDSLSADLAFRLVCEGTGLLWRGDFHNARHLLQALARRADRAPRTQTPRKSALAASAASAAHAAAEPADAAFQRYRQAQSLRAQRLSRLLIPLLPDHSIPLRRAPDHRLAIAQAWGEAAAEGAESRSAVISLRELSGIVSAFEWRKNGVEVPPLGPPPNNRIHPHYGVFSPVRGEYLGLVAQAPLPAGLQRQSLAFDIGTGTGVLAALLARRGVQRVLATDIDPRALACAQDNLQQLHCDAQVQCQLADLFPTGRAALLVCNPPWLPAQPGSALERAVYDPHSSMLLGFLDGLAAHLLPDGEGWLILSDLAEHLGLRSRHDLMQAIEAAGLVVQARHDTRPVHRRAADGDDPLHAARAAEVTSLWRLRAAG